MSTSSDWKQFEIKFYKHKMLGFFLFSLRYLFNQLGLPKSLFTGIFVTLPCKPCNVRRARSTISLYNYKMSVKRIIHVFCSFWLRVYCTCICTCLFQCLRGWQHRWMKYMYHAKCELIKVHNSVTSKKR